ncbi:thiamine phosphate synthase [Staphylococcus pasteuri]|uniref:thiamine phosphate synthase n=1 Tax=Staphylococcus TaxID=1279 RepID=UPI0002F81C9F|nr:MULTISPECIES: thiamine phosphate synthase [Staphylococcus]ODB63376.1 thiamine-phosphate diphosphorylase [Staphylococcus sp. AOAB]RQX26384.1 thiamine phosphate synthase [Staphylococcus warneri]MBM6507824.1 thiamine phosphate synthase [Staphylococcus pasteuri]MCD9067607.1 thiamine phosphate synthase [Staphylococcus pasteuri]MCO5361134.1 thiamine phosphate synthase [Staphylococcus pasteuri]
MEFKASQLKIYFICGTQDIPEQKSIKTVLTQALEAGITMFQFREKGENALKDNEKEKLAKELQSLCQSYHVPFIVNDDVSLAKKINADGIHVGQDDEDVKAFAYDFQDKIIGLSVGNISEYETSDLTNVDYIGVGPMFNTPSKSDASEPVGPEMIKQLRQRIGAFPIVAIGGITEENVKSIADANADGISIISAISRSQNIDNTVNEFKKYFN